MRFERVCMEALSRVVAALCFAARLLRALFPTLGKPSHTLVIPLCILTHILNNQSYFPFFPLRPPCSPPSLSFLSLTGPRRYLAPLALACLIESFILSRLPSKSKAH